MMDMKRAGWMGLPLILGIGACNLISGAEGYVIGPAEDDGDPVGAGGGAVGPGSGAGATSGGAGATGPGSGGAGVGAGEPTGVGGMGTPPPTGQAADGVTITDLQIHQAIAAPLMGGSSAIPIIAGKDAMVRVFYQTDGGYDGGMVTARFTAGDDFVDTTGVLSGSSSQSSLSSTLNIDVPGSMITVGGTYRVDLLQANGGGTNAGAGYPPGTGQEPHGAQSTGSKLRLMLVPVQYGGQLPDTSPSQVARYKEYFEWQYPVPEVEVTVRSQAYSFNGNLSSYNGWSQLLDDVSNLRQSDGAPADQYYYGIHMAQGSGLLGLGWVAGANDVWSRAAIGVGWSGDTSPETAVHEIGHNHGRSHSPCGVSGDANYPHNGAVIGVWGYNPSTQQLLPPNDWVDFMSYCDPQWVSDYTFKALFNRLKSVNGAQVVVPAHLKNRVYDRVRILDGEATWLDPWQMELPPIGELVTVMVTTSSGAQSLTGHYFPYNHLEGGVLFMLAPEVQPMSPRTFHFVAEGMSFQLSTAVGP